MHAGKTSHASPKRMTSPNKDTKSPAKMSKIKLNEPPPRRKAPAELMASLFPFQEEGLAWMCEQEKGSVCGGILADEVSVCLYDDERELPHLPSLRDFNTLLA
jgi:SNF2 family DNA or RNA helicase